MPGVEPCDVPSLSENELLGGLLDSLPDLLLSDVHDTAEVLAVESDGGEHLKTGLEQGVLGLVVLGDRLSRLEFELVLLFECGQVLGDDGVVPLGLGDFLSLDEPLVYIDNGKGPSCCHIFHLFRLMFLFH